MLHNDSFVSLAPLSPNGDKTIAICRPVLITKAALAMRESEGPNALRGHPKRSCLVCSANDPQE